jgi:gas vesicle protein
MLVELFDITILFWVIGILAFLKLMQVSNFNTEIEKFLKYDSEINVNTKPEELAKTLTTFYKSLKGVMENYKEDSKDKRYPIYKDLKSTIESYQEETYAYRKSEAMDEAPTGENVIEVAKIEFKIKTHLAKLKKLLKPANDINFLWLVIFICFLLIVFIKNS